MVEYRVHQSHLKSWEDRSRCRTKWYHQNVLQNIPRDPGSEQMTKGHYFETLAIGANVHGEDLPDISFLYNKNGSEKAELTRIKEQVSRFKELFNPSHSDYLGFEITNVQMFVQGEKEEGTIDFEAVDDFERKAIFDLKFTADVDSRGRSNRLFSARRGGAGCRRDRPSRRLARRETPAPAPAYRRRSPSSGRRV